MRVLQPDLVAYSKKTSNSPRQASRTLPSTNQRIQMPTCFSLPPSIACDRQSQGTEQSRCLGKRPPPDFPVAACTLTYG
jgi:hypothetical protein